MPVLKQFFGGQYVLRMILLGVTFVDIFSQYFTLASYTLKNKRIFVGKNVICIYMYHFELVTMSLINHTNCRVKTNRIPYCIVLICVVSI